MYVDNACPVGAWVSIVAPFISSFVYYFFRTLRSFVVIFFQGRYAFSVRIDENMISTHYIMPTDQAPISICPHTYIFACAQSWFQSADNPRQEGGE